MGARRDSHSPRLGMQLVALISCLALAQASQLYSNPTTAPELQLAQEPEIPSHDQARPLELTQTEDVDPKLCQCTGWKPTTGKWKGTGHKCAYFGWTTAWCYVLKGYEGPGYEFVKPSTTYKGKFYAPYKYGKAHKGFCKAGNSEDSA